jgi:hypothetical protein
MADNDKEIMLLEAPKLAICEWIPFGTSNLKALNDNMGSFKRIKNALFTHSIEEKGEETSVIDDEVMTKVYVVDYDATDYIMFEAEINYPEEEGIVQEEYFGCYVDHTGRVMYGMELVSAEDQGAEGISVDNISRILADAWEDSSKMMSNLITPYQQSLIDLVFLGNADHRDKFNLIITDSIKLNLNEEETILRPPGRRLTPAEIDEWGRKVESYLLDGEDCEAELRQIINEVQGIHVLTTGAFLVVGSNGVLFVRGPIMRIEEAMSSWMFLNAASVFLENLFHRLFVINASVIEIQEMMEDMDRDPNSIERVQDMLVTTSSDTSFIDEIVLTLEDAVNRQEEHFDMVVKEWEAAGALLSDGDGEGYRPADNIDYVKVMGVMKMFDSTDARVSDMKHNLYGTQSRLKGLRDNINATNERRMHQVQNELQENSRTLEDITRTNERTGTSLQILELILAAALAFELLNMTVGEWSAETYLDEKGAWVILERPGMLLLIALIGWLILAMVLIRKMRGTEEASRKFMSTKITYNSPMDAKAMARLIDKKRDVNELIDLDGEVKHSGERIKISWKSTDPKWRAPLETTFKEWIFRKEKETEVTIVYDAWNNFLLHALVEIPAPPDEREIDDLEQMLSEELVSAGVIKTGIVANRQKIKSKELM